MFLWVHLVVRALEAAHSIQELRKAVDTFPEGLEECYNRILERIKETSNLKNHQKALRVLRWISFARRPLKTYELQWGITLYDGNTMLTPETKPLGDVIDICRPLIEDGPSQTIQLIHASVKE